MYNVEDQRGKNSETFMDIREQNKNAADQTRERLLSSALDLLIKKGYRGAVTREVAKRAGVTEMTLFRHFRSKDELLIAVVVRQGEEMLASIPDRSGDLRADLLSMSCHLARQFSTNLLQLVRILPELEENSVLKAHLDGVKDELKAEFLALVKHWMPTGGALAEYSEDMLFRMFLGPLYLLAIEPSSVSGAFDTQQHVDFFLRGCGLEKV
jgi:AcrR family transcriptional regulator